MTPVQAPAPVAVEAPKAQDRPPVPPQVVKKTRPRTISGLGLALKLNP